MEFEPWFCCLHGRERQVLRALSVAYAELFYDSIPLSLYNAIWFATGDFAAAYREAFIEIYGLEIVTIEEDPPLYNVAIRDLFSFGFWFELEMFLLTPPAACLDGCTYPRYGEP